MYLGNHNLTNLVIKAAKYLLKTELLIKIRSKLINDNSIIVDDLDKLANLKLLNLCIEECVVCNIDFEKFLKNLRKSILLNRQKIKNNIGILELSTNLAINSFLNEYIWSISIDEKKEKKKLKDIFIKNLKLGCKIHDLDYVSLGMYSNLIDFNLYNSIKFNNITRKLRNITITNNLKEKIKNTIKHQILITKLQYKGSV